MAVRGQLRPPPRIRRRLAARDRPQRRPRPSPLDRPAARSPDHDPDGFFGNLVGEEALVSPHDDLATVAEALRALPAEQRETLIAAAYYGFTAREMSEAWNIPLGTVKTRIRLAMAKLRTVLAGVTA
jgi:RNA polymerase sigma-70 factor, ECF subfamily